VDCDPDQQAAGIGHDMALAPLDPLGRVPRVAALPRPRTGSAARPAALGAFDRLAVDHPGRRAGLAAGGFALLQQQFEIDPLKYASIPLLIEIPLTVVNGGKSFANNRHWQPVRNPRLQQCLRKRGVSAIGYVTDFRC
jgi:hypothetical protein